MFRRAWLPAARRTAAPARRPRTWLSVEALEDRATPATIAVADATLNEVGVASAFVVPGSGGLSFPRGIALDADGNLYVASGGPNSVLRYEHGRLLGTFVAANAGGMTNPYGLAVGPDGNLYVSSNSNVIYCFSGSTGGFLSTFVTAGSGGLGAARGISFGPDGNLYVADFNTDTILRYQGPLGASPGSPLPSAGNSGATFVAAQSGGLDAPHTALFGPDGNLYVASNVTNNAVLRFHGNTGSFLNTFVAPGSGGLIVPRDLAFDQDGRLYLADAVSSAVHRYDGQGQFLDDPVAGDSNLLIGPFGMAFNGQGGLLIASGNTSAVVRYDAGAVLTLSEASAVAVTVTYGTVNGTATAGADFTGQTGTVTFAPGQTTRRVLLAARDDLSVEAAESFTVQLSNATGGATIADGTATITIVDDDADRRITIGDATTVEGDAAVHYRGAFVNGNANGAPIGGAQGQFQPITFGPDGRLYVGGGNRVRRYDPVTGEFIDTFVSARLSGTRDIRFRGNFMYVGSEGTDEVLRFNAATGAFDSVFVAAGSGSIDGPHGLAFGPDANGDTIPELYVTGRSSSNVVRYDGATGQPLGTYIASGAGGLLTPEGLTFDPSGTFLFVTG